MVAERVSGGLVTRKGQQHGKRVIATGSRSSLKNPHLQYDKLAWSQGEDRKQGETYDEAGGGAKVASSKDQQTIPAANYNTS
jgi:hypothetical protein